MNKKSKIATISTKLLMLLLSVCLILGITLNLNVTRQVYATNQFNGTNLAGTVWEFSEEKGDVSVGLSGAQFSINFTDGDGNSYSLLKELGENDNMFRLGYLYYDDVEVADDVLWHNEAYRKITITGGDDSTNASSKYSELLGFLNECATLLYAPSVQKPEETDEPATPTPATGVVENVVVMELSLFVIIGAIVLVLDKKRKKINK